jgi:hypothetical protein
MTYTKAAMNNLYRGPSIYASYQISIHLAKRRFLEIDQPETTTAYGYSVSEVSRKHLCKVLYNDFSFRPDPLTNMATIGNSYCRLVDF